MGLDAKEEIANADGDPMVREAMALQRLRRALLAAPFLTRAASAQTPLRSVRIVVPFAPGGISDIVARAAAEALAEPLGQTVVVENRAGAGGNIGAEAVAKSTPDGLTLLAVGPAVMGIAKPLYPQLGYNPDLDFAAIGLLGAQANVLVASPRAPFAPNMQALVAAAKAAPGRIAFGSSGAGSLAHLTAELLAAEAGIQLLHVPYRGSPPAMADLLAGQIHILFDAVTTVQPLLNAGQINALAVATSARQPALPDVPSVAELGYPGVDAPNWFGLFAPAATPPAVLARLRAALEGVTAAPAWAAFLAGRSATALPVAGGAPLEAFLASERRRWAEAVRRSGAVAG